MKLVITTNPENRIAQARATLLDRAQKRHGRIIPCDSWDNSFTLEGDTLFFWYNTPEDHSTHVVSQVLDHME